MTEPELPQKSPYVVDCDPGTYAWCACGRSAKQPYCDGSHKDTGFKPVIEHVETARRIAWCGCKRSNNGAFCDGTHASL